MREIGVVRMLNRATEQTQDVPGWAKTAAFLIGSVGFPIVVSGWLLYRIAPILEQQTRLLERVLWILERGGGM